MKKFIVRWNINKHFNIERMNLKQSIESYTRIVLLNAILLLVFRLLETALIVLNFGIPESLFQSEIAGLFFDLAITNVVLLIAFPIFSLIYGISKKLAVRLFVFGFGALATIHFLILKYFLYQLIPLDTFVYQYSLKEILLTINTSNISYLKSIFILTILWAVIYITNRLLNKTAYQKLRLHIIYIVFPLSVAAVLFIYLSGTTFTNFSKNKSLFFFSRSIAYFSNREPDRANSPNQRFADFQKLYPGKTFQSNEYPLIHKFKNLNVLKPYFRPFQSAPNVVILIVEGLNDDFIHQYKGAQLMPYLSQLAGKSLYWKRCFTLGERSFAVVPSLLGSLPYGESGFTLLKKLPKHLSLVSILKENNYQASFFYGQGAWFHQKDRFFKYNNIDRIVDNSKFSEKYKKIIVGNDHFFWGYNDKDLFNQSLEVIDTLSKKPRLDIYFTGTSHSPFVISDPEIYGSKFTRITEGLKNDTNKIFFNTYKKYIESVLFVDDALKAFFKKYETRPEYDNTIFIVTGDHPMTEIPIDNSIKRYHVPLIIYSKNLITAKTFTHSVSHLDIYEPVLSFLSDYKVKVPVTSAALGSNLITDEPESEKRIAFMNDNREIIDYYNNNFFLSADKLYSVNTNLSITASTDQTILRKMQKELAVFKNTNAYVSLNDKILPDSIYYNALGYRLIRSNQINTDLIQLNTEYYDLAKKVAVKNKPIFYDISFEIKSAPEKGLSLVYQLSTANDSIIFWGNTPITSDMKIISTRIEIPKQNRSDSVVFFGSYFWNKSKQNFKFGKLKYAILQK